MHVQAAQLDKEHIFAFDVDVVVSGGLERHVVDGADVVASFGWMEGRTDQSKSSASIVGADRRSFYN